MLEPKKPGEDTKQPSPTPADDKNPNPKDEGQTKEQGEG